MKLSSHTMAEFSQVFWRWIRSANPRFRRIRARSAPGYRDVVRPRSAADSRSRRIGRVTNAPLQRCGRRTIDRLQPDHEQLTGKTPADPPAAAHGPRIAPRSLPRSAATRLLGAAAIPREAWLKRHRTPGNNATRSAEREKTDRRPPVRSVGKPLNRVPARLIRPAEYWCREMRSRSGPAIPFFRDDSCDINPRQCSEFDSGTGDPAVTDPHELRAWHASHQANRKVFNDDVQLGSGTQSKLLPKRCGYNHAASLVNGGLHAIKLPYKMDNRYPKRRSDSALPQAAVCCQTTRLIAGAIP